MYKIKVLNDIAVQGLENFSTDSYSITPDEKDPDAILLRSTNINSMKF